MGFPCGSAVKNTPAMQETQRCKFIPGSGRSTGGGHGHPLQYSCLKNTMDRGTWWTSPWNCKELDSAEVILKDILVIFKILAVLNKAVIKWACLVAQTVKNLIAVLVAFKILIVLNKAAINAHAQVFVCMQVFNSFR